MKAKRKKKINANKLTPKQEIFCKEYLIDLNATQAAIRAGYAKKTAEVTGCRLLRNVKTKKRIDELKKKRADKLEITAEYVLNNIVEIGERCMQRVPVMVRDGKKWKQKEEYVVNPETGEEELVGVWEFKEIGALKAQELLGKHLKLFTEMHEHTIVNFSDKIKEARNRLAGASLN